MKRGKQLILLMAFITAFSAVMIHYSFADEGLAGSGTADDPYRLSSTEDWDALAELVENGAQDIFCTLTEDIEIFRCIGSKEHPFSGLFDGSGHELSGWIAETSDYYTAPFRFIKNASISCLRSTVVVEGGMHCAGIAGGIYGECELFNCSYSGEIFCSGTHAGGLVGHGGDHTLSITGCAFRGNIYGAQFVGALLGWCDGCRLYIRDCVVDGGFRDAGIFSPVGLTSSETMLDVGVANCLSTVDPYAPDDCQGMLVSTGYTSVIGTNTVISNVVITIAGSDGEKYNASYMTLFDKGIFCCGTFYAPAGETVSFSLNPDVGRLIRSESVSGNLKKSGSVYSYKMTGGDKIIIIAEGKWKLLDAPDNTPFLTGKDSGDGYSTALLAARSINTYPITDYTFVSGSSEGYGGEAPENLWDGSVDTKFCHGVFPAGSISELDEPRQINGIILATANDNAEYNGRNPENWTVAASVDGSEWDVLARGDSSFFKDKNLTYFAAGFENTGKLYRYVRFEFEAPKSALSSEPNSENIFQLSDVAFCSPDIDEEDVYSVKDHGKAGDNIDYTLYDDGTLTLEGYGPMWDFYNPWYPDEEIGENTRLNPWSYINSDNEGSNDFVKSVVFDDRITHIGEASFDCAFGMRGTVKLPADLVSIGKCAFWDAPIDNVIFNDKLEDIAFEAFWGCPINTQIELPDSLVKIDDRAFYTVPLTGDLIIPDKVTYIGNEAFYSRDLPITEPYDHEWESGWRDEDERTYSDMAIVRGTLEGKLVLGSSVEYIGDCAFAGQPFSGDLVIPDSVTYIGGGAFYSVIWDGNPASSFFVDGERWYTNDQTSGAFAGGTLTLGENVEIICWDAFHGTQFTGDLVIPDKVTEIGPSAFHGIWVPREDGEGEYVIGTFNGKLTIGSSVEFIGEHAFKGQPFTGSLIIPDNVTGIGEWAFQFCTFDGDLIIGDGLKDLKIQNPDNPDDPDDWWPVFACDRNFTGNLVIGDGIEEIPGWTFDSFGFKGTLTLGKNIKRIENFAFANNGFTGELTLPQGLEYIGESAFWDPDRQDGEGFTGDLIIPAGVMEIGESAFDSAGFTGRLDIGNLTEIPNDAFSQDGFTGPLDLKNVTYIGGSAFSGNRFTGDLDLSKVTFIDNCAFMSGEIEIPMPYDHWWEEDHDNRFRADWSPIKGTLDGTLTLSEDLTFIGDNAFRGQSFKGSLRIPDKVTYVGWEAFRGTYWDGDENKIHKMIDIDDEGIEHEVYNVDWITTGMFEGGDLYIGKGIKGESFNEEDNLPTGLRNNAFEGCGFTGNLTIGIENIEEWQFAHWTRSFTGTLELLDSVRRIGECAFESWDHLPPDENGEVIHIPTSQFSRLILHEGLEYIGVRAFNNIPFKGDLVIPDSVTEMEWGAFENTGFDGSLTIGCGLKDIPDGVFSNCGFTGTLTLKNGIESIGSSAFRGTAFTGDLTIPASVKTIGDEAFASGFNHYSNIYYHEPNPDDPNSIGGEWSDAAPSRGSFNGILTLNEGLETIGDGAFAAQPFTNKGLVIPSTVRYIGSAAFSGNYWDGNIDNILIVEDPDDGRILRTEWQAAALRQFTGDLTIGRNVTEIGDGAFEGTGFDGNLTLGENVETIGASAFKNTLFKNEDGLVIPDSVTRIGWMAFAGNEVWIGKPFDRGWTYYDKEQDKEFLQPYKERYGYDTAMLAGTMTGPLTLSRNLQYIGSAAFWGQPFSGDLYIPDSVTDMDNSWRTFSCAVWDGKEPRFTEYDNGTCGYEYDETDAGGFDGNLYVGKGIPHVEGNTFSGHKFKGTLTVGAEEIWGYSFAGKGEFTHIEILDTVRNIDEYAFGWMPIEGELVIPKTVETISTGAFCNSGMSKVTFEGYIGWLQDDAFAECLNLTEAYFSGNIPDHENAGERIFGDPERMNAQGFTIRYAEGTNWAEFEGGYWNGYKVGGSVEYNYIPRKILDGGEIEFDINYAKIQFDGEIDPSYTRLETTPDDWCIAINSASDARKALNVTQSAEVFMAWDEDYLYYATKYPIQTEQYVNGHVLNDIRGIWAQNCLQVSYSDYEDHLYGESGNSLEVGLSWDSQNNRKAAYIWLRHNENDSLQIDDLYDNYEITVDDDGYVTIEYRTPWSAFTEVVPETDAKYTMCSVYSLSDNDEHYIVAQLAAGIAGAGTKNTGYNAVITLIKEQIYGDIDNDGVPFTPADAMHLARWLAGWEGYDINEAAANLDGDKKVTVRDAIILARHIARWKGYETLPYRQ